MPGYSDPGFDTLALHAGAAPDPATGARAVPIHLTTSFVFESSDHAAALFNLERSGHVYSRISNPTNAVLEQRVAALEGGIGAIATASGQAALHLSIATLMGAGSHIVASTALYGGSQNLLHYTLRRFGIDTTFVQPGDLDGWRAAIRPDTKLLFGETVGNPGLDVLDIPAVADIAHAAGVPLLVDSTLTSPYLIKPFDFGADLVYHSATKFLSGHGTVIGGVVVDSGAFDWEQSGKFAELTQPYEGFHNMVFSDESTVGAFLLRARREGLRDFGASMSPHTAWLILQGIETLPLRMERHIANTQKVVEFLAAHTVRLARRPSADRIASEPCARAEAAAPRRQGRGRGVQLRHPGQPRSGQDLHRGAQAVQPPGQRGRLPQPGDSSGQHHAFPHERRSAGGRRHFARDHPAVDRARRPGGPDRRPQARAAGCRESRRVMELLVDGHKTFCYTGGKALDAAKPTVMFIHGVLNDHSVWILQSRWFANHGWNVLALDLPGHCRSEGPPPASVEDGARFVLALLDAAGVQKAALVGHSFGSLIALEAAARAPQRVTHLALLGTACPMAVSPALLSNSLEAPEKAIAMDNAFSHSTLAPPPSTLGPGTWLLGGSRALMRRVLASNRSVNVFHVGFKACNDYANGEAAIAAVQCPILFLIGSADQMTPPRAARALAARVPAARTVAVEAGHQMMSEAPDAVLFALRDFLAA